MKIMQLKGLGCFEGTREAARQMTTYSKNATWEMDSLTRASISSFMEKNHGVHTSMGTRGGVAFSCMKRRPSLSLMSPIRTSCQDTSSSDVWVEVRLASSSSFGGLAVLVPASDVSMSVAKSKGKSWSKVVMESSASMSSAIILPASGSPASGSSSLGFFASSAWFDGELGSDIVLVSPRVSILLMFD